MAGVSGSWVGDAQLSRAERQPLVSPWRAMKRKASPEIAARSTCVPVPPPLHSVGNTRPSQAQKNQLGLFPPRQAPDTVPGAHERFQDLKASLIHVRNPGL